MLPRIVARKKRVERKEREVVTTNEVRSQLVLVRSFHGFHWPAPRALLDVGLVDTLGGYRLTAIRLNLFHHKRLNKEVHSSGAATPSGYTAVRETRPTCPLPLSASVHHLRPSIWIASFPRAESSDERDSTTHAIVPQDFSAIQPVCLLQRKIESSPLWCHAESDGWSWFDWVRYYHSSLRFGVSIE